MTDTKSTSRGPRSDIRAPDRRGVRDSRLANLNHRIEELPQLNLTCRILTCAGEQERSVVDADGHER